MQIIAPEVTQSGMSSDIKLDNSEIAVIIGMGIAVLFYALFESFKVGNKKDS